MALPANFAWICPACNSPVNDERATRKNPKAPDVRCSNARCTGAKNGKEWCAWVDWDKGETLPPRSNGAAPTGVIVNNDPVRSAPPPSTRISRDDFVLVTHDLTEALLTNTLKLCRKLEIDPSPTALLEQVCGNVRQFWICVEKGAVASGAEPPPPASLRDQYRARIDTAMSIVDIAKIMASSGGDTALDALDKETLAAYASERVAALGTAHTTGA